MQRKRNDRKAVFLKKLTDSIIRGEPLRVLRKEFIGFNSTTRPEILNTAVCHSNVELVQWIITRANAEISLHKITHLLLLAKQNNKFYTENDKKIFYREEIEGYLKKIQVKVREFNTLIASNASLEKIQAFVENDPYHLCESLDHILLVLRTGTFEHIKYFLSNPSVRLRYKNPPSAFLNALLINPKAANDALNYIIDVGFFSAKNKAQSLASIILNRSITNHVLKKFTTTLSISEFEDALLQYIILCRDYEIFLFFIKQFSPLTTTKIQKLISASEKIKKHDICAYLQTLLLQFEEFKLMIVDTRIPSDKIIEYAKENHHFLKTDHEILELIIKNRDLSVVTFFLNEHGFMLRLASKNEQVKNKIPIPKKLPLLLLELAAINTQHANELITFFINNNLLPNHPYILGYQEELRILLASSYVSFATIKKFVTHYRLNFNLTDFDTLTDAVKSRDLEIASFLVQNSIYCDKMLLLHELANNASSNSHHNKELTAYFYDLITKLAKLNAFLVEENHPIAMIKEHVITNNIQIRHELLGIAFENSDLETIIFFLALKTKQTGHRQETLHSLRAILKNKQYANEIIAYFIDNHIINRVEDGSNFTQFFIALINSANITSATIVKFEQAFKDKIKIDTTGFMAQNRSEINTHIAYHAHMIDIIAGLIMDKSIPFSLIKLYFLNHHFIINDSKLILLAAEHRNVSALFFFLTDGNRARKISPVSYEVLTAALKNSTHANKIMQFLLNRKLISANEPIKAYKNTLLALILNKNISFNTIALFTQYCEKFFADRRLTFDLNNNIEILEAVTQYRSDHVMAFFKTRILCIAKERPHNLLYFASLNREYHKKLLLYFLKLGVLIKFDDTSHPLHLEAALGEKKYLSTYPSDILCKNIRGENAAYFAGLNSQHPFAMSLFCLATSLEQQLALINDFNQGLAEHYKVFPKEPQLINLENALNQHAEKYGLTCTSNPLNHGCLFYALSSSLKNSTMQSLRELASSHILEHASDYMPHIGNDTLDDYCLRVRTDSEGDRLMIHALVFELKLQVCLIMTDGSYTLYTHKKAEHTIIIGRDVDHPIYYPLISKEGMSPKLFELFSEAHFENDIVTPKRTDASSMKRTCSARLFPALLDYPGKLDDVISLRISH